MDTIHLIEYNDACIITSSTPVDDFLAKYQLAFSCL